MNGVLLLHGTFVDEFLIEIVLPLSIFAGLYWWSARKENKQKAAAPDADAVRGERAAAPDADEVRGEK
jgi:hypothetical protein